VEHPASADASITAIRKAANEYIILRDGIKACFESTNLDDFHKKSNTAATI
jgi:hypothetical protein